MKSETVKNLIENMTPEEVDELAREGRRLAWKDWYSKPENRERKREYNRKYSAEKALRAKMGGTK